MRTIGFRIISIIAFLAIFYSYSIGAHVPGVSSSLSYKDGLLRERRQVETFDDEYSTGAGPASQEEPGFWDRVVKVALKLFSRFVEWLNSS